MKYLSLRADIFKDAGTAAESVLKTPYLAKGLAILTAPTTAAFTIFACDWFRFGKRDIFMCAVVGFS